MSEAKTYQKATLITALAVLSASFINTMGGMINPAIASLAAAYPNTSLNTIMLASTLPMFMAIPVSFLSGKIIKTLGAKGALLVSFGLFMVAGVIPAFLRTSFTSVLVCRAVSGFVSGVITPVNATLVNTYIEPDRRPAMFGYKQSLGSAIGIGLMSLVGIIAAKNVFNIWFLHLILVVPLLFGLLLPKAPDWGESVPASGAAAETSAHEKESIPSSAWVIIIIMLLFSIFSYPAFLYLSSLVEANQMGDAALSGFISTASTAGGVVGSLVFGQLYKVAKKRVVPLFMLLLVVNYLTFAFTRSVALYFVGNFIGGIGYFGMFVALTTALSVNCPPKVFPTAAGVMTAMMSLGIFASSYIISFISKIAGQADSLTFPFVVCSAAFAVLVAVLTVKPLKM